MSNKQRFASSHGFKFNDWKQTKDEPNNMIHCVSTEDLDYYNGTPDQVEQVNNSCLVLSVKRQSDHKSPYKNSAKASKSNIMSASNGFELLKNPQKSLSHELKTSIYKKNALSLGMQNVSNTTKFKNICVSSSQIRRVNAGSKIPKTQNSDDFAYETGTNFNVKN